MDFEPPELRWPDPTWNLKAWNGFFNWTMSYRRDSDITSPYGIFLPRKKPDPKENQEAYKILFKRKKKFAAWFVSNCDSWSKRELYVKELQKFIPVDIYGSCGNFSCTRKSESFCDIMLERDYKFYLAFENSICKDYATEKVYRKIQKRIIPIVLSREILNGVGPSTKWFIAADDFSSPKDLAAHLKFLSSTELAYTRYLSWRQNYTVEFCSSSTTCGFCKLCEKLRTDQTSKGIFHNYATLTFLTKITRFARKSPGGNF